MAYLIDGHNLIPKIPGMNLDDLDDEAQLIQTLRDFCRKRAKKAEIYFDNAPPGGTRTQKYGRVTAHFIRQGRTADQAIRARLHSLGRSAPNWTVVTSDREVAAAALETRAKLLTSQDFAHQLGEGGPAQAASPETDPDLAVNPDEVAEWLEFFKGENKCS